MKFLKKIKSKLFAMADSIDIAIGRALCLACSAGCAVSGNEGEGYVDTAVKILMAVVIGALVLAGLYALFGDTVMPTLTQRIQEMFDYAG